MTEQIALRNLWSPQRAEGTGVTPFLFQGSYTDGNLMVCLINRYYDPSTGQFISVDPLVAETGQPYAFTGDDPLNRTDPLGLIYTCGGQSGDCAGGPSTGPELTKPATSPPPTSAVDLPSVTHSSTSVPVVQSPLITISVQAIAQISGPNTAPNVSVDPGARSVDITGGPSMATVSANGGLSAALSAGKGVSLASNGSVTVSTSAGSVNVDGDTIALTLSVTFQAHPQGLGPLLGWNQVGELVGVGVLTLARDIGEECVAEPEFCLAPVGG